MINILKKKIMVSVMIPAIIFAFSSCDGINSFGKIKNYVNSVSCTQKLNNEAEPVPIEFFYIANTQVPDRSIFDLLGKRLVSSNKNYVPYKIVETSDKLFRRAYYKIAGTENEVVFVLYYKDINYGYAYDIFLIEYRMEEKTICMDFDRYKVGSFDLNKTIMEYEEYEYVKVDEIIKKLKPGVDEKEILASDVKAGEYKLPSLRDKVLKSDDGRIFYLLFEELSEDKNELKGLWKYYINDNGQITKYTTKNGVFAKENNVKTKECVSGNIELGTDRDKGYLKNIFLLTERFGSPDIINDYDGFSLAYYFLLEENSIAVIYLTPDYMHSICLVKKLRLNKKGNYSYGKLIDKKMIPAVEDLSFENMEFKNFMNKYGIPYGRGYGNFPEYKYPYINNFLYVYTDSEDKITITGLSDDIIS